MTSLPRTESKICYATIVIMNLKSITRLITPYLFLAAIVLATIGTLYWDEPLELMREILALQNYWISIVVYTGLIALATIFAPLSVAPTVPFMAKIFGPFTIFVSTWVGWMVGAIVVFYICRIWGQPLAERFFSLDSLDRIHARMPKNLDFSVLLLLRLFVPVDVLSYAVGLLSKISFQKYVVATAIGIIPFAFILSYGPDALTGSSPWLLFSFFALLFAIVGALAVYYFSEYTRPKALIYTHSGKFHADDVFAVATLQLVLDKSQRRYQVIRTRDMKTLDQAKEKTTRRDDVFIVDVGDSYDPEHNQFDHHQFGGAGERHGVQYAAFGLVWQKYGVRLCNDSAVAEQFDTSFVCAIDAPDNAQELFRKTELGIDPITLHTIIEQIYRQAEGDDQLGQDADFAHAVDFVKKLITKSLAQSVRAVEKEKRAGQVYHDADNKRIIVTEEHIGRNYFVKYDQVQLIVSPRTGDINGEWGIATIPETRNGLHGRVIFPRSWWGLRGKELQDVSGIAGAKFVHRSGDFIAVAHSRKSAIEMAKTALEYFDQHNKK